MTASFPTRFALSAPSGAVAAVSAVGPAEALASALVLPVLVLVVLLLGG